MEETQLAGDGEDGRATRLDRAADLSPGGGLVREIYAAQLENLASHGFVVVAVTHPYDGVVAVYPDGHWITYDAKRWPEIRTYPSAEALWAGEQPDFVDICTPPAAHAAQLREALVRGAHILCEKPVCRTAAEAESLDRMRKRGRVQGFELYCDESERVGGEGTAPSPLGYFTAAVGF